MGTRTGKERNSLHLEEDNPRRREYEVFILVFILFYFILFYFLGDTHDLT